MAFTLAAPSGGQGICELADYAELRAVLAQDRNSSMQDLVQDLKRSGTATPGDDDLDDDDEPQDPDMVVEPFRAVAEEAFAEIDERSRACGTGTGSYPFTLLERAIQTEGALEDSLYLFLLVLSKYGKDAGPRNSYPERLFEDICTHAASRYFGGDVLAGQAVRFGSPRAVLPKNFKKAIDQVCAMIGDGSCGENIPRVEHYKDGGLDIVCWRPFPDKRHGTLIGFGQCATGKAEWRTKALYLRPDNFMDKFMRERFAVAPTRLYFVPWRVERQDWRTICVDGGILLDRCRIALLTKDADAQLKNKCGQWVSAVLSKVSTK